MNRKLKLRIVEQFGSQADFAQKAEVDESTVSRIIRGRRKLSADEKSRWAQLLKIGQEVFSYE
jgi:plasmid maintenance system antidote protein VapI